MAGILKNDQNDGVIPTDETEGKNPPSFDLIILIATNVVIIFLAFVQNWSIMTLLWLYWAQSVIIGISTFLKIILFKNPKEERPLSKWIQVPLAGFFLLHYGMFHLTYFIFLEFFSYFGIVTSTINLYDIIVGAAIFAISHFYFFIKDYIYGTGFDKYQEAGQIMTEPYFRIIPMHITIIFGGFLYSFSGGSQILLIFFLVVRLFVDIWSYKREKSTNPLPIMKIGQKVQ